MQLDDEQDQHAVGEPIEPEDSDVDPAAARSAFADEEDEDPQSFIGEDL